VSLRIQPRRGRRPIRRVGINEPVVAADAPVTLLFQSAASGGAPLNSFVMRLKRRRAVMACCILLFAGISYWLGSVSGRSTGRLVIAVTDQWMDGSYLMVSVVVRNAGPRTFVNGGNSVTRCEVNGRWKTDSDGSTNTAIFSLLPGESLTSTFAIPREATRLQVGYSFQVARTSAVLACRLAERGWLDPLGWAFGALLKQRGDCAEFWSTEYDVKPRMD
jgi:hypothetical protein